MKTFALLGLLLGSSVAFSPAETPNARAVGSSLESTSTSEPHFATGVADVGVDTPVAAALAVSGGEEARKLVPPGALAVYDEAKTGIPMPDAQRQRRATGLPGIRAQQFALGVSFINGDADKSRGFSFK
jgi:hypothetical protein